VDEMMKIIIRYKDRIQKDCIFRDVKWNK